MDYLLNIFVKLYSYTDSDIRNLRKFEYFDEYFLTLT